MPRPFSFLISRRSFAIMAGVTVAVTVTVMAAGPSLALDVLFEEDAPRDRLIVENRSDCPLPAFELMIDLRPSSGRLVFDTEPSGAGVNVAQPFRLAGGAVDLVELNRVEDGDTVARLAFSALPQGGRVVMTADLDDSDPSGPMGRTMVAGSEIAGAEAVVTKGSASEATTTSDRFVGVFDGTGRAVVTMPDCAPVS